MSTDIDLSRVSGAYAEGMRVVTGDNVDDPINEAARAQAVNALTLAAISGATMRRAVPNYGGSPGQGEREVDGGQMGSVGVAAQWAPDARPTANRSTPDTGSSWGRTQLFGYADKPTEMARVTLDVSGPLQLTITVLKAPGAAPTRPPTPLTVWCRVVIGGGSGSADFLVRATAFASLPLVASQLQVIAYVGDASGAPAMGLNLPSGADVAQVSVQVARGVRASDPIGNTAFEANVGVNFALGGFSQRLRSVAAHLTASQTGPLFLQLFDQAQQPGNGDVPIYEAALGAAPEASAIGKAQVFESGLPISVGLWAATSSTSGTLTGTSDDVWCQIERYQF